jgi:hypothetical protein
VDDYFFDRPDLFRDHRFFVTLNDVEFPPLKTSVGDIRATRCRTPLNDDPLITKLDSCSTGCWIAYIRTR